MAPEASPAIDDKLARAFGHPVRARALVILGRRTASPKEIAEEIGEPIGKVSYHVRELCEEGLIELVHTDGSRGGVQHFYRACQLPILDVAGMEAQDDAERAVASNMVLSMMMADVSVAFREGTFDARPERMLGRFAARVDERGWRELSELLDETLFRSIEIHNESIARLQEKGEIGMAAALHLLMFEMPDPDAAPAEPRYLD
jgi:DNA-binding transcriptional ArsR family regulator